MDDELLDVYDERGWHRGVKARADVHRDGDWHRAFHLWVVSPAGVLLQRRARHKASWPGRLDATAAGHLVAGEQIQDGLREADEELGAAYVFADLVPLGAHRVDDAMDDGGRNREVQHVFAVRDDRPLDAWTAFDRRELDGLILVSHPDFRALAERLPGECAGHFWDGELLTRVSVSAQDLVPSPYLADVASALRQITAA